MKNYVKALITVEVVLAFAAPCLLLALLSFMLVGSFITSPTRWDAQMAWILLWCTGGFLGMWGVAKLWYRVLQSENSEISQLTTWVYVGCGCAAFAPIFFVASSESLSGFFLFVWPYIVLAHLLRLNRDIMFLS